MSGTALFRLLRALFAAATVGVLASATACGENAEEDRAIALRARLGQSYLAWPRVPGFEQRRESATAHGTSVDVYWNEPAVASAALRPFEAMQPRSILIKEAYADGKLKNIAVMEKGFDGWFWAEWGPDGDILFSGRPGACIDCHRRGEDFMRTITPSDLP